MYGGQGSSVNLHSNSAAKAFGGLALNQPVGGLNPYAVENSPENGSCHHLDAHQRFWKTA